MTFEELEKLSIIDLKEFYRDTKDNLFDLFMRLDIRLLRLGIMSLSFHSLHCNTIDIFENDDILCNVSNLISDLYASKSEISRREKNV